MAAAWNWCRIAFYICDGFVEPLGSAITQRCIHRHISVLVFEAQFKNQSRVHVSVGTEFIAPLGLSKNTVVTFSNILVLPPPNPELAKLSSDILLRRNKNIKHCSILQIKQNNYVVHYNDIGSEKVI
jgi:hypothetical protein